MNNKKAGSDLSIRLRCGITSREFACLVWGVLIGMVFVGLLVMVSGRPPALPAKENIIYKTITLNGTMEKPVYVGEAPHWFYNNNYTDDIERSRIAQEVRRVFSNREPWAWEGDNKP